MKENFKKKFVVYSIIFLFIGAAITPNIFGNENIENIILPKCTYKTMALDIDDYINAFWKFDECSGNTVGDSSGHDYDGTRYGATWTTNGYSGCALDFDGNDDYVDLTDHVKGIAVNKTDDYIISFYFKSTSNEHGIILSYTGYKNVPEFRIELQPNGSILFKIWTGLCGMICYSDEDHNDGSWHQVEIIFNGISTDPTIKMYIDDKLEEEIIDWLCPIDYTDYLAAAIGKRASDDTGFFDGIIDEIKFILYPKGNDQNPPTIDGPTTGLPDIEYDFSFITVDPEEDEILSIEIDWDDGEIEEITGPFESGEEVIVSHTWIEEDRFDVKARSIDAWDESPWSTPYIVKIGNQPPSNPDITGQRYGDPDEEITYTFIAYDEEGEDIKYEIDWGDGTTTETNYQPSGTQITETHSWDTKNDYNMKARAIDTKNKDGDWEFYPIRIGDKPPENTKIYGAVQGLPGVEYEYALISTDPENDNLTYEIDWGDGNVETDLGPIPSGEILVRSHSFNKTKKYTIKVRTKDEFDYYNLWSEHSVTIPRNKASNQNLLELIFEKIPNILPLFRCLFKIIFDGGK
jgi:hypothetical protein